MKFNEITIKKEIIKAIDDLHYEKMSPIQEKSIPAILNGENIIGEAETGTGKTAAFVIPLLNKINDENKTSQALIVSPTRELALQINEEIKKLAKYLNISVTCLVGGSSYKKQYSDLKKKPQIIVGTLGRILDHINNKKLHLSDIKYFVLDEADEMLKDGFIEDIISINEALINKSQTLLFSATINENIKKLSKKIMSDYHLISVKDKNNVSSTIEQFYIVLKENDKFEVLTNLLDINQPTSAIIFGRTKRRVDELSEALISCGYNALGLHGDLSQEQRNHVMRKFRDNKINILVATDVAARGLDISNVSHVYNFDLPQEVEFYIHRVGRTGRARKKGVSYSLVKKNELGHIRRIKDEEKVTISEKPIPSAQLLKEIRYDNMLDKLNHKLEAIDMNSKQDLVNKLIDEFGKDNLIYLLVDYLTSKKNTNNKVSLTSEPSVIVRGKYRNQQNNNTNKVNNKNHSSKRKSSTKKHSNKETKHSKRNIMIEKGSYTIKSSKKRKQTKNRYGNKNK
ncbi:MAG: DEAD/DEAH box helicase [Bacilli bacterium]|jgi:ATP-dependent RNA helicase DeaD|nr:DEAD/DEAH box helicase [Bacilli bacterium]